LTPREWAYRMFANKASPNENEKHHERSHKDKKSWWRRHHQKEGEHQFEGEHHKTGAKHCRIARVFWPLFTIAFFGIHFYHLCRFKKAVVKLAALNGEKIEDCCKWGHGRKMFKKMLKGKNA